MIAGVTFHVAYLASTVLGTVLLQTSPRRGLSGGKMEAFLRVMREVSVLKIHRAGTELINYNQLERHPQVLHLPAPHLWQLTPTPAVPGKNAAPSTLIATLELHVKDDLGDDEVLALTNWAWERCTGALNSGSNARIRDGGTKVEVTIGIVRG
jgi:hypothetical protein